MKVTLANLEQASEQDIFTQVATHLLTQNEKSFDPRTDTCRYRTGKLACAAGCLISDEEYKSDMDYRDGVLGTSWDSLVNRELAPSKHQDLISALQHIHDGFEASSWLKELEDFAQENNLEMPNV